MPENFNIVRNSTFYVPQTGDFNGIQTKKSFGSKFLSVLGGVARTALNFVSPGLGSAIGGIIGNGGNRTSSGNFGFGTGSYQEMIADQQRTFEEMQKMTQLQHSIQMQQSQTMTAQSQRSASDLLLLQNRVANQSQEFSTISNLLKSRHDSRSHAIQNLKA